MDGGALVTPCSMGARKTNHEYTGFQMVAPQKHVVKDILRVFDGVRCPCALSLTQMVPSVDV
eukprot:m.630904 g.630904  ORF g.630904 m.630904 type:complete len:62 (-) comp22568_c0_seq18:26-211(-)